MPELPEVETIVADLRPRLIGRTVRGVTFHWPGTIATPTPDEFARQIAGSEVLALGRRGKHILATLSGDRVLIVHLRMSGRLVVTEAGDPELRFQRLAFQLDDGAELRYADMRKFGRMWLLPKTALEELNARLGPEPLAEEFTVPVLRCLLEGRKTSLKAVLLDQSRLAGIGNIYADEAFFLAGVHPHRRADSLSGEEVARLHAALRTVLADSIENRGTTFRDYRDAHGKPGDHQDQLLVYRRTGAPCRRCGTPIARQRFGGRGTHFCPRCQPFDTRDDRDNCGDRSVVILEPRAGGNRQSRMVAEDNATTYVPEE